MSRACHKTLVFIFIGAIVTVPALQGIWEKAVEGESLRVLDVFKKVPSEAKLRAFEKELEDSSKVAEWLRPGFRQLRWWLMRDLGDKAVPGSVGWAYYGPNLRYLTEAYFRDVKADKSADDPAETIADFANQLGRRGIRLLVVPIPSKPVVSPEHLRSGLDPSLGLAVHTRRFMDELRGRGIEVADLFEPFVHHAPYGWWRCDYLDADTHWSGECVPLAAKRLAARARAMLGPDELAPRRTYRRERITVYRQPDIPRMSQLPLAARAFPPQRTLAYRVLDETGEPYSDVDEAPILLLGDSFSRIYQTDEPGAAGLIANLAFELQTPLASIVNDGGASTLVRQELARNLELLEGKRLVIWEFAERDLRFGLKGWERISLDE